MVKPLNYHPASRVAPRTTTSGLAGQALYTTSSGTAGPVPPREGNAPPPDHALSYGINNSSYYRANAHTRGEAQLLNPNHSLNEREQQLLMQASDHADIVKTAPSPMSYVNKTSLMSRANVTTSVQKGVDKLHDSASIKRAMALREMQQKYAQTHHQLQMARLANQAKNISNSQKELGLDQYNRNNSAAEIEMKRGREIEALKMRAQQQAAWAGAQGEGANNNNAAAASGVSGGAYPQAAENSLQQEQKSKTFNSVDTQKSLLYSGFNRANNIMDSKRRA